MNENPFDSGSSTKSPFNGKKQKKGGSGLIILGIFVVIIIIVIIGSKPLMKKYHNYRAEKSLEEIAAGTYDGDYSEFEYLLKDFNFDFVEE